VGERIPLLAEEGREARAPTGRSLKSGCAERSEGADAVVSSAQSVLMPVREPPIFSL